MAINPDNITTIRVDQLPDTGITLESLIPHTNGTELNSSTVSELVTLVASAIESGIGVGFLPVSVTDGQTLPAIPTDPSFILVGAGTYINLNGFPDLICTEELNAIMSLSDHWEIAVEIPIVAPVGVQTVTGSAVDNTDPQNPVIDLGASSVTSVNSDTGAVIVDLQSATDEGNVVEYGAETTFAKYQTSADVFAQIASDDDGFVNFEVQQAVGEKTTYTHASLSFESSGGVFDIAYPKKIAAMFAIAERIQTTSFTAETETTYIANGTLTVTDPTPVTNKGYIVHVIGGTSTIGGVGYTTGALVYRYYDGSSWISKNYNQDLQSVTDNGSNIDGNDIVVKNGLIEVINNAEDKFADFTFDGFAITDDVTADVSAYKLGEISNNSIVYPLPTGATSQIATLLDISNDAVLKSDYTPAHSILVQQSGTGTPTALSVGNNTLVGRLSGGGSDINDLSVSDVRTLLDIDTDLATKADKSRVEQILRSKNNGTYGSHTGNTTNTVIQTISITGGEFEIGDWMNLMFDFTKVGTAGNATIRFYAGTLGTTSDPLIASIFLTSSILDVGFSRERFQFKTGNILSGISGTYTSNSSDLFPSTLVKQSTSLTPSSDWILTVAVQLANSGDTVSCEGYVISKINSF
jgi:hypothetical protein